MAQTIKLHSSSESTLAWDWSDDIYLTLRKDGLISVKGEIDGEDPDTGARKTFKMDSSESGIKSSDRLIEVIRNIEEERGIDISKADLIDCLEKLDIKWAFSVLKILCFENISTEKV